MRGDREDIAPKGLDFVERQLGANPYLMGPDFSAADIMMGFPLVAARLLGVLDDHYPKLNDSLTRLESRPAFQKAATVD